MQLFHLAFLGDIIRNVRYFLICLRDMVIQNNAKKTSQSEFQNTTHTYVYHKWYEKVIILIWNGLRKVVCTTLLTCVGQVGFFTWGCVVTQAVMNLLHVAFSQPPILF